MILVIQPPPVAGIGNAGGVRMMVEDRAARGSQALLEATTAMVTKASQTPGLTQVFTLFENSTPQIYLDIDRTKAQMLGDQRRRRVRRASGLYRFGLRQ